MGPWAEDLLGVGGAPGVSAVSRSPQHGGARDGGADLGDALLPRGAHIAWCPSPAGCSALGLTPVPFLQYLLPITS